LPLIARLTLVEWYLERAADAWHELRVLATSAPRDFEIASTIASGTGPLRRQPDSGYRGANYDLISITAPSEGTISFALDTRRARSEVRGQQTQAALVQKMVERAATARDSDPKLGSTLFKLLVPLELKPFLSGNDRLLLQLDRDTAPIPWELLDTDSMDTRDGAQPGDSVEPWSIRTRLLRKLLITDFRNSPHDANAEASVLVIGEPKIDSPDYASLPGARNEAKAVAQQFRSGPNALRDDRVVELTDGPEFDDLMIAVMARPYRIVHIAGHGAPPTPDSRGGVVLSEGIFLGPDEIVKLSVVPELVFVNCCHLGAFDTNQTLKMTAPTTFAAGMAESLISIGVRCVVAAGWAVDDGPAKIFATRFYEVLLGGRPFVDAVVEARKAARTAAPSSKTWAAYQCYGDPNWVFKPAAADAQADAFSAQGAGAVVASAPGLALLLENLAVRARYDVTRDGDVAQTNRKQTQDQLRRLELDYGAMWAGMGAVAEAFAVAWDAAGDREQAISWYERAVRANDGSASLKAQEQFGNLRVRRAWSRVPTTGPLARDLADQVRDEITAALSEQKTLACHPTIERLSICASAWKRLGQLEARCTGHAQQAARALQAASEAYREAEEIARGTNDPQLFYPGLNRMAIEWVRHAGHTRWAGFDAAATARVEASLRSKHELDPDFWTNAGLIELEVLRALAARDLTKDGQRFIKGYADLQERVGARGYWSSVADQARFTLEPFIGRTRGGQRTIARNLLERLEGYAQ
jgi:tetratricopeptide (TPR) repeat protein